MNWQDAVVYGLVLLAAAYLARTSWRIVRGAKAGCGSCSSCGSANSQSGQLVSVDSLVAGSRPSGSQEPARHDSALANGHKKS